VNEAFARVTCRSTALSLYHEGYGEVGKSKVFRCCLPGAFYGHRSEKSVRCPPSRATRRDHLRAARHGPQPRIHRQRCRTSSSRRCAALLRALKVERGDVRGYSTRRRGRAAARLRHRARLGCKRVSSVRHYRKDGWYRRVKGIEGLSAKEFGGTPVEKAFQEHTPKRRGVRRLPRKMRSEHRHDRKSPTRRCVRICAKRR